MFRHVLVPLDGSDRMGEAVEVALHLTRQPHARLTFLHVSPGQTSAKAMIEVNESLDHLVAGLRAEGKDAHALIEFGGVADHVAETADYEQCDLIVLTPRLRSGLDALQHPSISQRMLSRAGAPLLIWPERTPPLEATELLTSPGSLVIVPLDGSPLAERALPLALRFAKWAGRPLLLLRVVPQVALVGGAEAYRLARELEHDEEQEARRYLTAVHARLARDEDVLIETMVKRGEPVYTIRRAAALYPNALIVMSTHGRGGLRNILLGSVARALLRRSPAPIVVVPVPARELEESQPQSGEGMLLIGEGR